MLVTLDELKTYLRITGTEEDQRLEQIRSAAESEVKRYCRRQFEYGNYTEETDAAGGVIWLNETPIESVTSVTIEEGEALTVRKVYALSGLVVLEQSYTGMVEVTYTGGLSTIPDDLKLAVLRLAEFFYSKTAGVSAENVGELRATYDELPRDVLNSLDLFRRVRI